MIHKKLEDITPDDIILLVEEQRKEAKTLEYKRELPEGSDKEKKEFLADVSSFANARGGDIIYGIADKKDENGKSTGTPDFIYGIGETNIDEQIIRLHALIRDGISPRLSVQILPVEIAADKQVIIIRIPESLLSPHMVVFKNASRFYSRNSSGKFQLDVDEIRTAFMSSESIPERIRAFRLDRISRILGNDVPQPIINTAKVIIHLFPLSSFRRISRNEDIFFNREIRNKSNNEIGLGKSRINFDGYFLYSRSGSTDECETYSQLYRNGCVEHVDTVLLNPERGTFIPSVSFEKELMYYLHRQVSFLKDVGITTPIYIMMSLIGVRGYYMALERGRSKSIERDNLLLPEFIYEDFDTPLIDTMKQAFDMVWQACGLECSYNFDEDGYWARQGNPKRI